MKQNNDLISRSALIAEYDRVHVGAPGDARKLMEDAPAVDAVEVVRCRDCLYFRALDGCPMAESGYFKNGRLIPHDTDFCSYGERKNDEQ